MKTIYIAGPVKGRDMEQVQAQFKAVQDKLETDDIQVLNPVEIILLENEVRVAHDTPPLVDDVPDFRKTILRITVSEMIKQADEVYMMQGWQDSEGATMERDIAQRFGIPITYM